MEISDIRYVNDLYQSYMVLDGQMNAENVFEERMIQSCQLAHLLKCQVRYHNEKKSFYFDITGLHKLDTSGDIKLSFEQVYRFARELQVVLAEIDEYLLDENSLWIREDMIYLGSAEESLLFVYCPDKKRPVWMQIRDFAGTLLQRINYDDKNAVLLAYRFYHEVSKDSCSIECLDDVLRYAGELDGTWVQMASETENESDSEFSSTLGSGYAVHETYEENTESQIKSRFIQSKLYLAAGAASLFIAMIAIVLLRFMPYFKLWILSGAVIGLILVWGVVAALRLSKNRSRNDDFWEETDDNVAGFHEDHAKMETEMNTTFLRSMKPADETTMLSQTQIRLTLKTVDPESFPALAEGLMMTDFPVIIGKLVSDHRFRINVATVSRRHVRIEYKDDLFFVTDLKSSNGTYLNGRRLTAHKPEVIRSGDYLVFSEVEFIAEIIGESYPCASAVED